MQQKTIIVEKRNGLAILTLNRPETLNAWNDEMSREATAAINEIGEDENTKVFVITGAGRGFSSGADVGDELAKGLATSEEPSEGIMQDMPDFVNIPLQVRRMGKPVISAINGIAAGAGLSIALACDLRIASERAQFAMVFVLRGLIPDCGGTFFLPKLIGSAKACELIFIGDKIDADEAQRIGLVSKVVPNDELMVVTKDLATRIAKGPPIAIGFAKRAIYKGIEGDLVSQLEFETYAQGICFQTEDHHEAGKAFMEKREAKFRGR